MGIINDFYILKSLDFISLAGDLPRYNPGEGWKWDWKEWVEQSEKTLKNGERFTLEFDQNPAPFDYDHKDIAIIAELKTQISIPYLTVPTKEEYYGLNYIGFQNRKLLNQMKYFKLIIPL